LEISDLDLIIHLINIQQLEEYGHYEFERDLSVEIENCLKINNTKREYNYSIRTHCEVDNLPYLVHTDRELDLMLSGKKPLAVFSDFLNDNSNQCFPCEPFFEPHLQSNAILKKDWCLFLHNSNETVNYLFYYLPAEEWRVKAYMLLIEVSHALGWNQCMERMQGRLLGYSEVECDIYLSTGFSST
jgi:hypothetical protein